MLKENDKKAQQLILNQIDLVDIVIEMKRLYVIIILFCIFINPHITEAVYVPKEGVAKGALVHVLSNYLQSQNTVRLHFLQLKKTKSIQYSLTYTSLNIEQAIQGNFDPNGKRYERRELFLGVCSATECVPHTAPKDIKLKITATYQDNSTSSNTYSVH